MRAVRRFVLATVSLAGCGGIQPVEGVYEGRPPWVDAGRVDASGFFGRGEAYAVSNPEFRISTADAQARLLVAREVTYILRRRLVEMEIDDAVRAESVEALDSAVYTNTKVVARFYARDRLRQYSLARLTREGFVERLRRIRASPAAVDALAAAGEGVFPDG
jgi:hypothetical protein